MSSKKLFISALILAATSSLFPALSQAQGMDCSGMGPGMGPTSGECGQPGMRTDRMKQRQQQMHDALKLNPEQEKAWVKYQESHPMMGAVQRPDRAAMDKLTAPERAEKMLEMSRKHQDSMTQHVSAMKGFYDTLTPEQKKTFDEQSMMRPQRGQRPGGMAKPDGVAKPQ